MMSFEVYFDDYRSIRWISKVQLVLLEETMQSSHGGLAVALVNRPDESRPVRVGSHLATRWRQRLHQKMPMGLVPDAHSGHLGLDPGLAALSVA
jgi:hypothetical protein